MSRIVEVALAIGLVGCHNDAPPPATGTGTGTGGSVTATATTSAPATASATATATPTASTSPSPSKSVASAVAANAVSTDPCKVDGDCDVTTFGGCCACCPEFPYATSKNALKKRQAECAKDDCAPCNFDESCGGVGKIKAPTAYCSKGFCAIKY